MTEQVKVERRPDQPKRMFGLWHKYKNCAVYYWTAQRDGKQLPAIRLGEDYEKAAVQATIYNARWEAEHPEAEWQARRIAKMTATTKANKEAAKTAALAAAMAAASPPPTEPVEAPKAAAARWTRTAEQTAMMQPFLTDPERPKRMTALWASDGTVRYYWRPSSHKQGRVTVFLGLDYAPAKARAIEINDELEIGAGMNMDRRFELVGLQLGGQRREAMRITCSDCGVWEHFSFQGRGVPPGTASKHFRNLGWLVGAKPQQDTCPKCMGVKPKPTVMREKIMDAVVAKVVEQQEQGALTLAAPAEVAAAMNGDRPAAPVPQAEPPKLPTYEEKRIINRRLEDVYEDENTGYDIGWNDVRVAKDLGVPLAWVVSCRETTFGPARENEELKRFRAEIVAAKEQAESTLKRVAELHAEATSHRSESGKVLERAKSIELVLRSLEKRAIAIDRALA